MAKKELPACRVIFFRVSHIKDEEGAIAMIQKYRYWLPLCMSVLIAFMFAYPAFAEVKVFEKETTWKAAKNKSQEQAERLAIMEAQQ
jgi:hypothetical protein